MSTILASLALSFMQAATGAPAASAVQLPDLTLEQASGLRCSVAFGLVHRAQRDGELTHYPVMAERGQEFFVRTTARLMDELGADRETIMGLVVREHEEFGGSPERLDEVMPACLLMLDASGL